MIFVEGILISANDTHFVTRDENGITTWSREYYRLAREYEQDYNIQNKQE